MSKKDEIRAVRTRKSRITFLLTVKEHLTLQNNALKEGYVNISDYIRFKLKL